MTNLAWQPRTFPGPALALAALILCSVIATPAVRAADTLGFYIGGAYGQAHIRARLDWLVPGSAGSDFDSTHSAYQAMVGIRPLSFLGAEITYVDLGTRTLVGSGVLIPALPGSGASATEQVSQKGEAAYALLYLPVPIVDAYVKAGLSRLRTDMSIQAVAPGIFCQVSQPDCNIYNAARSATETAFAYGAGLQWKLGQWAIRGEYERFSAAGANPSLISVGMTLWLQ